MADGKNCAYLPPGPAPPSCSSSQYGCCLDGTTVKNADGSNCSTFNTWTYNGPNISGVAASGPNNSGYIIKGPNGNVYAGTASNCVISPYGCCPDMVTSKNTNGSNCNSSVPVPAPSPSIQNGCSITQYGCCSDNVTAKNADGSNCSPANAWKYTGPNFTVYGVTGQDTTDFIAKGQGNLFNGSTKPLIGGCAGTQYGCCPDNVTAKYADGSNCSSLPVPAPQIGGCAGTQYGCCPDNITYKNSDGSNCSSYPPLPLQTNTVFIPPPKGLLTVKNNSYDTNSASVNSKNNDSNNTNSKNNYDMNSSDFNNNDSKNNYDMNSSDSNNYTSNSKCPEPSPCPPCGRCPEPSFDCRKVPNYASTNSEYLPMPVLSDFSQFGM